MRSPVDTTRRNVPSSFAFPHDRALRLRLYVAANLIRESRSSGKGTKMYPSNRKKFTTLASNLLPRKRCLHVTSRRLFHLRILPFHLLIASVRFPTWSLTKILCCSL